MARDLLRKGAAVGAADEEGMTALHQASVRGHTAIVGELLWQHADINSQTTVSIFHMPFMMLAVKFTIDSMCTQEQYRHVLHGKSGVVLGATVT